MDYGDLILTLALLVACWGIIRAIKDLAASFQRAIGGDLASVGEALWDIHGRMPTAERLDGIEARQAELVEELVRLDTVTESLPIRWEEMYQKVRRTEERARGSVRRAMEELEEAGLRSGELEGTLEDLRREYGDGGADGAVRPLPAGVGNVPAPARAPTLTELRNRRLFG